MARKSRKNITVGNIIPAAVYIRTAQAIKTGEYIRLHKLRDVFGKHYDYAIFKEAETDVSKTLDEKPMPKKSIKQQLQPRKQKSIPHRHQNPEIER